MSRQHAVPYLIQHGGEPTALDTANREFDERWLQNFLFRHPGCIPLNEIEPAFGELRQVCRELPTKSGAADILFVNDKGLLTLCECKLWSNPQARREVVGQILDYAKDMSQWSYDDLQKAIHATPDGKDIELSQLAAVNSDSFNEADFVDTVSRNLRRGRMLLLIAGDGIRENVEQLTDFMLRYAHLNFALALMEVGVYRLPDRDAAEYIVQSRVVAQTVEVEKAVVRIEDGQIVVLPPRQDGGKGEKVSVQVVIERMEIDAATRGSLSSFLDQARGIGIYAEVGNSQNTLILRSENFGNNFGIFTVKGDFWNASIASSTDRAGHREIGEHYLEGLAGLLKNGVVNKTKNRFDWCVKIQHGGKRRYARAAEVLAVKEEWLELLQRTLSQMAEAGM